MDRKSIIILVACVGLLLLWYPLVNKLYPPKPRLPDTNDVTTAESAATNQAAPTSAQSSQVEAATSQSFTRPDAPEELMVVANENARYTFTSHGGGLKLIELVRYPETIACNRRKDGTINGFAKLNEGAQAPVLAILGGDAVQGDGVFQLTAIDGGVRAEKTLTNGLRWIKEFKPTTNYLVEATVRWENQSDQPLVLPAQEWSIGAATPMGPRDDGSTVGLLWFNGAKPESAAKPWFDNRFLGCFPGTPRPEYIAGTSNVVWASVHNQFFALVVVPKDPAQQVVSRQFDLPPPTIEELVADPKATKKPSGFQTALIYPSVTLPPNGSIQRDFYLYTGPKEYRTLAKISATFRNELDLMMEFGWFFGFFSKALLLSMNALNSWGLSYGWAIIVITIIIKLIFWPLTNASTKSMKRMAALQPQMKAIQDKYKDDPMKGQRKVMEFMKENKVNPMGSCLPMLLQMPVFIGFFYMIRTAIELRGASFLWACDLSTSDTIFVIPGLNFPVNPLPLLMGVTMLWQAQLMPASPGMDPVQQKIMKYMPLMFMVFLYNFSSGLTLYWTVQNLLTIAQTKLTKTTTPPATPAPAPVPTAPQKKKKR